MVSSDGAVYAYRYELMPPEAGFRSWRESRKLAARDWVDLGRFAGDYKLEQIWLQSGPPSMNVRVRVNVRR